MIVRFALLGLMFSPLVTAADSKPVLSGAVPEPALQFHPIRANGSKRADGSLKPGLPTPEYLPIMVALRMHTHSDGSVSYGCDEDHSAISQAEAPDRSPTEAPR